ncbi:hypothetical protein [Kitasatospora phosalacinea]|uniref:hypothetical protein n=1 Tax=Kitasatospora phosalacinea TaxID=2065 RepID=UPI00069255B3|nr:hypothetical protein [Kitasatospora phosalacinea]
MAKGRALWWPDRVRDRLLVRLLAASGEPYGANVERAVPLDEHNAVLPDVTVFDGTGPEVSEPAGTPVESVVPAAEAVSPGRKVADRSTKPGLDAEKDVYFPVAAHEGPLRTGLPFPVEIDLKRLVER